MRALLPLALLAACATTPNETAPTDPIAVAPEAFLAGANEDAVPSSDAYWRTLSADAVLTGLLDEAGRADDVAIAEARSREAEALARAARASLFPNLTGSLSAESRGQEGASGLGVGTAGLAVTAPLDPFGANRATAAAARARGEAARADLDLARLETRRRAGQLYAALRAAQASRLAAERQTKDAEDSLALARARAAAGLDTGLAIAQAQTAADVARSRIPGFAQAETQARLALETLLGVAPGAFAERLAPAAAAPLPAERLLDTPVATLERRPDVRAARARLAAAGLDARSARASRWPTATLSAALTQTSATRGLDGGAGVATATLAATLFDFGRLESQAMAAGARADAEAAGYQRTVTNALGAVEREADRLAQATREVEAGRAAAASARNQAELARARYRSGLSSFLDVLVAERALADAEIALAGAEGRSLDAAVGLAAELGLGQAP